MKWILMVVWMAQMPDGLPPATGVLKGEFDSAAACMAEAVKWAVVEPPSEGYALTSISCKAGDAK